MDKLLSCPFCGSNDIRRDIGWLECNSCGCYGPNAEVNDDDTISKPAIAAWNQRATDAELQRLQDRVHWLEGQNKRLQAILDGWQVENYGDY